MIISVIIILSDAANLKTIIHDECHTKGEKKSEEEEVKEMKKIYGRKMS